MSSPHPQVRVGGHAHVPVFRMSGDVRIPEHGHVGVLTDPHLGVRATRRERNL